MRNNQRAVLMQDFTNSIFNVSVRKERRLSQGSEDTMLYKSSDVLMQDFTNSIINLLGATVKCCVREIFHQAATSLFTELIFSLSLTPFINLTPRITSAK